MSESQTTHAKDPSPTETSPTNPPRRPKSASSSENDSDGGKRGNRAPSVISAASTDEETTQVFYKVDSPSLVSHDGSPLPTYEENADGWSGRGSEQCTIFNGITFIGSSAVDAPVSELEINRKIELLRRQASEFVDIKLSIPMTSNGSVKLIDDETGFALDKHDVKNILFCARGKEEDVANCLAFTTGHKGSGLFRCHVLKAADRETANHILKCIGNAFQNPDSGSSDEMKFDSLEFDFDMSLDILEDDGKGGFSSVARDRDGFKLKQNIQKKLLLVITQTSNKQLSIERCFGVLVGAGKNLDKAKLHLLDIPSAGVAKKSAYEVTALWNPSKEEDFAILNAETPKDTKLYMTVAVDFVFSCLAVPLRFTREVAVRIYRPTERFWLSSIIKQTSVDSFRVFLKDNATEGNAPDGKLDFLVEKIELVKKRAINWRPMSLLLGRVKEVDGAVSDSDSHADAEEEDDEPIMSGTGQVDSSWTDDQLSSWSDLINKWDGKTRSKRLVQLVRKGIPERLRGQVWQMLSGATESFKVIEDFPVLVAKDSPSEQVIQWDINRTFPGHDFFKDKQGEGQAALYKISKAYSVYDTEVGYCQGLSFLIAVLLLHMPEEQAFAVLVNVMFDYGLRDLFKSDFELLHIYFYQLKKLMEAEMPDLYTHFTELDVEPHMFASQWFLTLFTAKFPLSLVYRIVDIVLCDGIHTVFKIALALLKGSRKELLQQDFEGILKHFRVSLPKKYSSEKDIALLLSQIVSVKVDGKKLKKLEREYTIIKEAEAAEEDPMIRLKRDNKSLQEANLRFERENDLLAQELVASKIGLRHEMDKLEQRIDALSKEKRSAEKVLVEEKDKVLRFKEEASGLKELYRKTVLDLEEERQQHQAEMAEYKMVRQQLDEKMQKEQEELKHELLEVKARCYSVSAGDEMDSSAAGSSRLVDLTSEERLRDMEVELAHYKLQVVESECRIQDLEHKLKTQQERQQLSKKKSWLSKLKS
eukprot:m.35998 g.35998  ORF g.35998 m.35998 type:complete len:986 (+) comp32201_c1_seq2:207-3164(+)